MSSLNNALMDRFKEQGILDNRRIKVMLTGEGLSNLAEAYVEAAQNHYASSRVLDTLKAEDLTKYFYTVLVLRVRGMNPGEFRKSGQPNNPKYAHDTRALSVPSMIGGLLLKIGVTMDTSYGFILEPVVPADAEVMDFHECLRISRLLWSLKEVFLPVNFPKPVYTDGGCVRFMSKALIGNYVNSYRQADHLEASFAAAIFGATLMEEAQKVFYYVTLGDFYQYRDAAGMVLGLDPESPERQNKAGATSAKHPLEPPTCEG